MINEIEKIEGDKSVAIFEKDGLLFIKREFMNSVKHPSITEVSKESTDRKMIKLMSYLSKSFSSRGWTMNSDKVCTIHFKNGRILVIKETFTESEIRENRAKRESVESLRGYNKCLNLR